MRLRQVKIQTPLGAVYEDLVDGEGMIEIARSVNQAGEGNDRTRYVVDWADSLGRAPTAEDFEALFTTLGITLVPLEGVVNHEN